VLHALIVIAMSLLVADIASWDIHMKLHGEDGSNSDTAGRHGGGRHGS
jgi:hypothetical protein